MGERAVAARAADTAGAPPTGDDGKDHLTQLVLTERGVWRGKHTFCVRLDRAGWGSSIGICKRIDAPYPTANVLALLQDGSVGLFRGNSVSTPPEKRVRSNLKTGDVVRVEFDMDAGTITFHVNGIEWVRIAGVTNRHSAARTLTDLHREHKRIRKHGLAAGANAGGAAGQPPPPAVDLESKRALSDQVQVVAALNLRNATPNTNGSGGRTSPQLSPRTLFLSRQTSTNSEIAPGLELASPKGSGGSGGGGGGDRKSVPSIDTASAAALTGAISPLASPVSGTRALRLTPVPGLTVKSKGSTPAFVDSKLVVPLDADDSNAGTAAAPKPASAVTTDVKQSAPASGSGSGSGGSFQFVSDAPSNALDTKQPDAPTATDAPATTTTTTTTTATTPVAPAPAPAPPAGLTNTSATADSKLEALNTAFAADSAEAEELERRKDLLLSEALEIEPYFFCLEFKVSALNLKSGMGYTVLTAAEAAAAEKANNAASAKK